MATKEERIKQYQKELEAWKKAGGPERYQKELEAWKKAGGLERHKKAVEKWRAEGGPEKARKELEEYIKKRKAEPMGKIKPKKVYAKPPAPLSEAEVNRGIAEYKKLEESRKPAKVEAPKIPKPKKLNPKRVGLAASSKHQPPHQIPPSPAERRMLRRPPQPKGEIKPSLAELKRKLEKAPSKGEIASYRGEIGHAPEKHAVDAFSSRISSKVPSKGEIAPYRGEIGSVKSRLMKGGRAGRIAALGIGALGAVGAALGAYSGMKKAEAEAQANREAMAVKYASPLTHQRRLREREASKTVVKAPSPPAAPAEVKAAKPKVQAKQKSGFGSAFAQARKAGLKEFEYHGKKYHTRLASEPTKITKAPEQKTETMAPAYDSQKFINNISLDVSEPRKANFGAFLRSKHPKLGTRKK